MYMCTKHTPRAGDLESSDGNICDTHMCDLNLRYTKFCIGHNNEENSFKYTPLGFLI